MTKESTPTRQWYPEGRDREPPRHHGVGRDPSQIRASLMSRWGLPPADPTKVTIDPARLDGRMLIEECLRSAHRVIDDLELNNVRTACEHVELADAIEAALDARLLRSYRASPDTTDGIVETSPVSDYRAAERYRLQVAPRLEHVPRGGRASEVAISDAEKSTVRAMRFAKVWTIDETDMDGNPNWLDLFAQVVDSVARMARSLRPDLVYSLLLSNPNLADGDPWWSAARGNGMTAALDATNLGTAMQMLQVQTQTDADGRAVPVGGPPAVLLLPPTLDATGRRLVRDMALGSGRDIEVRAEPRLELGVVDPVTGETHAGSTTMWALFAPASSGAAVEVALLDGRAEPRVYVDRIAKGGKWGLCVTVKMAIGAAIVGTRGFVASTGAG